MISVHVADKSFADEPVLRDVSFSIDPGACLAILGPSGIGKSTLLRIIAGLDEDFSGHVTRPDRVAMVFQEPTLLPWRTAQDNLTLTTGIADPDAIAAMDEVGLSGKEDHFPGQLSLGQQRRLALARAIAAQPELLILDEPFASLDQARAQDLLRIIRNFIDRQGIATLFVTHSETEAAALADKTLRLGGTPASIMA